LLGNSKNPEKVNKHIKKCFEGIKKLSIVQTAGTGKRNEVATFEVRDLISPE
jgi:dynein heavy chain